MLTMTLSETPGAVKRFRRSSWRFQETFQTPLKDLQRFVAAIISAHGAIQSGSVVFDSVVFDPKHVIATLTKHSLPITYGRDWELAAVGRGEVAELLESVLSDWIDFIFVPKPRPFVIYADHDEFITFYTNTKSNLNFMLDTLSSGGFKRVQNYQRHL